MKKPVNNDRKMTRTTKKKVALIPRDALAQELAAEVALADTLLEGAVENNLPTDVHPLFLTAQHAQVCRQLMEDLSGPSTLFWLNFASALLRDHYLELMKPPLWHRHQNWVELSADHDLVDLINQLIKGVSLEQAMKNRVSGQTRKLLLIRGPEQLGQESWDLLFTLARDFPALNIAYLLCWSDQQQQDSQMLKSLRATSARYEFGLLSQAAGELLVRLETEAGMSAARLEELSRLLDSIVESA
jgi:hypothetical protein